jgi:hypothetical protein
VQSFRPLRHGERPGEGRYSKSSQSLALECFLVKPVGSETAWHETSEMPHVKEVGVQRVFASIGLVRWDSADTVASLSEVVAMIGGSGLHCPFLNREPAE